MSDSSPLLETLDRYFCWQLKLREKAPSPVIKRGYCPTKRGFNVLIHCLLLKMFGSRHHQEELSEDSEDGEDIQYGVLRSRRPTSYHHRDLSSLTPAQRMEQEVYYKSAEETSERSLQLAQSVCLLLAIYHHYIIMIDNWQMLSNIMANGISVVRDKIQHIKNGIDRLLFC